MASPPGAAGAPPAYCPRCGAALPMEGRFCGNCGPVIVAAPVPAAPATGPAGQPAPVATAHRTMMGMQAAPAPPSVMGVAPQAPKPPAQFNAHKTMMGVSMADAPVAPSHAVANAQSTMMGVVSPIAGP